MNSATVLAGVLLACPVLYQRLRQLYDSLALYGVLIPELIEILWTRVAVPSGILSAIWSGQDACQVLLKLRCFALMPIWTVGWGLQSWTLCNLGPSVFVRMEASQFFQMRHEQLGRSSNGLGNDLTQHALVKVIQPELKCSTKTGSHVCYPYCGAVLCRPMVAANTRVSWMFHEECRSFSCSISRARCSLAGLVVMES